MVYRMTRSKVKVMEVQKSWKRLGLSRLPVCVIKRLMVNI